MPAGAVPKDGPSAGVAIAAALISLFRHKPIHQDLAMTGEVTLTGRVLPVGGVREKILAARRAGIKTVLIPRHNEKDLVELPAEVKADLTFHAGRHPRRRGPAPLPRQAAQDTPRARQVRRRGRGEDAFPAAPRRQARSLPQADPGPRSV